MKLRSCIRKLDAAQPELEAKLLPGAIEVVEARGYRDELTRREGAAR
jgi:hypothetical protein